MPNNIGAGMVGRKCTLEDSAATPVHPWRLVSISRRGCPVQVVQALSLFGADPVSCIGILSAGSSVPAPVQFSEDSPLVSRPAVLPSPLPCIPLSIHFPKRYIINTNNGIRC